MKGREEERRGRGRDDSLSQTPESALGNEMYYGYNISWDKDKMLNFVNNTDTASRVVFKRQDCDYACDMFNKRFAACKPTCNVFYHRQ